MKSKKCWALWSLIVFDSVLYYFLERKLYYHILYFFSLWIVKSLQLYRRRQITELHKYCLVWFFFFFGAYFFSVFASYKSENFIFIAFRKVSQACGTFVNKISSNARDTIFFTICDKLVYCDWSNIIFIIAHH